jgi:hypothetical protein
MKYKIVRLDGRWSYRQHFEYAIIFSNRMTNWKGPQNFSVAQQYFFDTYGWSAEIRLWSDIQKHYSNPYMYVGANPLPEMPGAVNPYWSWTNGYDDLRIYVKSPQELTLFQLKYPVDQ